MRPFQQYQGHFYGYVPSKQVGLGAHLNAYSFLDFCDIQFNDLFDHHWTILETIFRGLNLCRYAQDLPRRNSGLEAKDRGICLPEMR